MNDLLNNIEVGQSTLFSIAAAMILVFLLPVIFVVLWKKRCGKAASFKFILIGAAGFLVSVRVLELGLHMVCIVSDNPVSRFINGSTLAYVLYGILAAGIFEECGRYVILRYIVKKNKTKENIVMYGIGHGGIEVWAITLLSLASNFAIALTLKTQGAEGLMQLLGFSEGVPAGALNPVIAAVSAAAEFNGLTAFANVFERFVCMLVHIGLTIIVAYGIEKSQKKYLLAAVIFHAVTDIFPALYQRGAVGIFVAEIWLAVCAVFLTIWSVKLYKKLGKEACQ
ncbi:MAG: YhfC family intramembrane metalloprotease [Oscillospiraceae bacterium]|nr:YhfC family intramembrane metalloprotease [Oscillospiraceae bacterium]